MKRRILFLLRFYVSTVAIFMVAKVAFMLFNRATYSFSMADVFNVMRHGLSLDLSTSLYLLLLPLLYVIAGIWLKLPRWPFRLYCGLIALTLSLAFVADTSLYSFWHFKLDASCLQYLETPTEAMASVSTGYLLARLLACILIAVAIYATFSWKVTHFRPENSTLSKTIHTLLSMLLLPPMVIGIRGGLSESTTNIGQVYYSQQQFLNHSAVNPVFSFLSSIGKSGKNIVSYDYFDEAECRQLTAGFYYTTSLHTDTLLNTARPNIVIIVMESCGGQFTEIGGHPDIMPRLNQLAHEGIYFTECYANSWRTDKGIVSILSGYPAFPITSVMKIPEKSRKLPSIASSLVAEGYATAFYYGGDINFTNMRSYVVSTGYQQLKWKADYPLAERSSAKWGVRDDLMFSSLLSDIQAEQSPHWMKTLLTLSSHEPWDVPTKAFDDEVYNAFNYLDLCIGQFVDSLKQTAQWKDMLVILVPDHGIRNEQIGEWTRLYNHIPMIWLGGAVREPRQVECLCNQSDLPATLLGQMQTDHSAYTFSRDVLSHDYNRQMAWHTYNNGVTLFDSTGFMVYDLDAEKMLASEGPDAQRQLQVARALLQLSSHDLIDK